MLLYVLNKHSYIINKKKMQYFFNVMDKYTLVKCWQFEYISVDESPSIKFQKKKTCVSHIIYTHYKNLSILNYYLLSLLSLLKMLSVIKASTIQ